MNYIRMGEGSEDVLAILNRISALSQEQQRVYEKSDARRALAGNAGNSLHSYWMVLQMLKNEAVPEGQDFRYIELIQFIRGAILVAFFSNIENGVRAIWGELKGEVYATATFDGVARGLITKLGLIEYQSLLDLCRTMRNAVHNNFIYRGDNKLLEWKTIKYECRNGQPLELFSSEILHFVLSELWSLVEAILASADVRALKLVDLGGWSERGQWAGTP